MKSNLIVLLLLCVTLSVLAQPPEPKVGYRWILNQALSDEFDDTVLNDTKWHDHIPTWVGRAPAIFLPSQLSLSDGLLEIRNKKLDSDTVVTFWDGSQATYSIAGGAIQSKNAGAFGYYECSMKASTIRMSSTFWMSKGNFAGPDPCAGDKYSLEIDIQEAIGGATENNSLNFKNHMMSNTHYKYTDCDGESTMYSRGDDFALPPGREVSDTFYVYGGHWKNENTVDMYLDGKLGSSISFKTDIVDKPFDQALHINAVTETYDWVTPPSDEDLADDSRNATFYDWIRSYSIIGVDESLTEPSMLENPGFETGNLNGWTGWGVFPAEVVSDNVHSGNYAVHVFGPGAAEHLISLKANTAYTLSCYGKVAEGSGAISFGIKDASENELGVVFVSNKDYTKKSISFTTGSNTALKFYYYAPLATDEGWADDFDLVEAGNVGPDPESELPEVFEEDIYFAEKPGTMLIDDQLNFTLAYLANSDLEIHLRLMNTADILIGEKSYMALAGFGVKQFLLELDSIPSAGSYRVLADIRTTDGTVDDSIASSVMEVKLSEAIRVDVKILDILDDSPIESASVSLGDSVKQSSSKGDAIFYRVIPGQASIAVEKRGYIPSSLDLTLNKDTSLVLRLSLATLTIDIESLDSESGSPLRGATVIFNGEEKRSNPMGLTRFKTQMGSYSLELAKSNYYTVDTSVEVDRDTLITIMMEENLTNISPKLMQDGLSIYPNPFSGEIHVSGLEKETAYSIVAPDGSIVKQGFIRKLEAIRAEDLAPGLYILKIQDRGSFRIFK